MSAWEDYNFPDIAGTNFQTALEGLMLGANERLTAIGKDAEYWDVKSFYEGIYTRVGTIHLDNSPLPILQAMQGIESLFTTIGRLYILPDGRSFSIDNAAEYLGEEPIYFADLVLNKAVISNYAWLMQRYRMVNCAYIHIPNSPFEMIYGEYSGESKTTWKEALRNYTGETLTYDDQYGRYAHLYDIFMWHDPGQPAYLCKREFKFPVKIKYAATVPARIFSAGRVGHITEFNSYNNVSMKIFRDYYHDFGTGLKQGDTFDIDFTVDDAGKDDYIPLQPDIFTNLQGSIVEHPFPDQEKEYYNGDHRRYMNISLDEIKYDLRPGLKFYDEIKQNE